MKSVADIHSLSRSANVRLYPEAAVGEHGICRLVQLCADKVDLEIVRNYGLS